MAVQHTFRTITPSFRSTYDQLVEAFLAHGRETPALLQRALQETPNNAKLHAVHALMMVLLGRSDVLPAAQAAAMRARLCLEDGHSLGENTAAISAYCDAAQYASQRAWRNAVDALETVLDHEQDDAMAAKLSHALRFMLGDKMGMLRSIERVLARINPLHRHYGFLLGCKAFALEENGFYAAAERAGCEAVSRESRDAWGLHAVSHVHEMTGRVDDGIRWIEQAETRFRACNNFGGHLFWHLALFKLEKGAIGDVLALYDREIRREKTDDFRDIANAASLLMRLELDGHCVGHRWEELSEKAETRLNDRAVVFADLHYMLALIGAGKTDLATTFLTPPDGSGDQASLAQGVGSQMAQGLIHYANGNNKAALEALLATRQRRSKIGGSDAQRDVFEQIMIETAIKSGQNDIAQTILAERLARRGMQNRFASQRLDRVMEKARTSARGTLGLTAALAFNAVPA